MLDYCVSGPCVHRLVSSERHAFGVRKGRQEKRADQEPRHTLRTNTKGAPGMLTHYVTQFFACKKSVSDFMALILPCIRVRGKYKINQCL